jgi:hypothetical protein
MTVGTRIDMKTHASHKTRISMDASSYDEICEYCGATDTAGSTGLTEPCPNVARSVQYDADYFLRGKQTGKSLYVDYRWLPDLTIPMVKAMVRHLDLMNNHLLLDFGCARGYVVRAFRQLGYECYGIDASEWAVANCDPEVAGMVKCTSEIPPDFNWIIAKDVLEHVVNVEDVVSEMMDKARNGIFAVVPLSSEDGKPYIIPD